MSRESDIYHRPNCKYTQLIKHKNEIVLPWEDAKNSGYHACRHCNNMSFMYSNEKQVINWNEQNRKMEFRYQNGILYVKTEMGCWKLVYTRGAEQIALYHRNTRQRPLDFKHPEQDRYHQQRDQLYFRNIALALNYIYEHDKFRAAEKRGDNKIFYRKEKYRKQAKKREQRASLRRVDRLFQMIEKENEEYKQSSFC
jgi:hypothetical protein